MHFSIFKLLNHIESLTVVVIKQMTGLIRLSICSLLSSAFKHGSAQLLMSLAVTDLVTPLKIA